MDSRLREDFLGAMARAATTVNVVTTDGPGGRAGATVSAMSSVSADGAAPTLLVCIHEASATAAAIAANGVLAVNVLRDDQSGVSDSFAGRRTALRDDKFACADWARGATGAPRLCHALAVFDCRVVASHRVGTHLVIIAAVEAIHAGAGDARPLIYTDRAYARATRLAEAPGLSA